MGATPRGFESLILRQNIHHLLIKEILSVGGFRFKLGGNFRSVAEGECHDAVRSYRNLIDHSEPEGFVPVRHNLWSFINVADKDVKRFRLGEPFPFRCFQFINPYRRFVVAFKVAVVALVKVSLALGSSGVFVDCLARRGIALC